MEKSVTINKEQDVFVIPCGNGFTCWGFDNNAKQSKALAKEMGVRMRHFPKDSIEAYNENKRLTEIAEQRHHQTGWRSQIDLYAPFIGQEGRRVEVTYKDGEKERFYIGKSTGFIPCHLMIKQHNSSGGGSVLTNSIKSFRFV